MTGSVSPTLDLIASVRVHVAASLEPAAALAVRRLKRADPSAPDPVVWDAAAASFDDVPTHGAEPSLVGSLLERTYEHPPEVIG
jgi:hypothetical protein